jgi:transcriptional regulator with XRE-family HTH domain
MRAGDGGPIKIGFSEDIARRVVEFQTASPYPLELLRVVEGNTETEARVQKQFKSAALHGEWFNPVPEVLEAAGVERAPEADAEDVAGWLYEAGLSQCDLARIADVDQSTISKWLSGATKGVRPETRHAIEAVMRAVAHLGGLSKRGKRAAAAPAPAAPALTGDPDADAKTLAMPHRQSAVEILAEIMRDGGSPVRADCAKFLISLTDGKPRTSDPKKKEVEPAGDDKELLSVLAKLAGPDAPAPIARAPQMAPVESIAQPA